MLLLLLGGIIVARFQQTAGVWIIELIEFGGGGGGSVGMTGKVLLHLLVLVLATRRIGVLLLLLLLLQQLLVVSRDGSVIRIVIDAGQLPHQAHLLAVQVAVQGLLGGVRSRAGRSSPIHAANADSGTSPSHLVRLDRWQRRGVESG